MSDEFKTVNMEIKVKIKDFIINNFLIAADSKELNENDSFLEQGIVDSTGILELVEFVQDTFGIKVEDEELMPDNLDSIGNIEKFVKNKLEMNTDG